MPTARELYTDEELTEAFPLMAQLRDRIRPETFFAEVRRQQAAGYHLIGWFDDGRLVALAGIRLSHTLSRGAHLFVDDLVTDEGQRGRHHGSALLEWIEARAAGEGCSRVYLDSRATAKGFYERNGYTFLAAIPCWKEVGVRPSAAAAETAS